MGSDAQEVKKEDRQEACATAVLILTAAMPDQMAKCLPMGTDQDSQDRNKTWKQLFWSRIGNIYDPHIVIKAAELASEELGYQANIIALVKSKAEIALENERAGGNLYVDTPESAEPDTRVYPPGWAKAHLVISTKMADPNCHLIELGPEYADSLPRERQSPHPKKAGWTVYTKPTYFELFVESALAGHARESFFRHVADHEPGGPQWLQAARKWYDENMTGVAGFGDGDDTAGMMKLGDIIKAALRPKPGYIQSRGANF